MDSSMFNQLIGPVFKKAAFETDRHIGRHRNIGKPDLFEFSNYGALFTLKKRLAFRALNLRQGSQSVYMKHLPLCLLCVIITAACSAQSIHVGVFGGAAAYNGDLTEKIFPQKVTNGAVGVTVSYELTEQILIRAGLTYAIVGGADRFSEDPELIRRNLSFETRLYEFSALGEYYLMNLYDRSYSPYLFAGLAVYRFNPSAYDLNKNKVFLKPLSTEGQGVAGYPDRKPYSLTQLAIPFGGGIKFAISENLRIGLEGGIRMLFTDYFDDISKNYISEADLLAARGQLAVDMSYRGDEGVGGLPTYPQKDAQRGSPEHKDYYYFAGLHLTYKLGDGGLFGGGGKRSRTGCPTNVY